MLKVNCGTALSTDAVAGANVLVQFTLSRAKIYFQHAKSLPSA